VHTKLPAKGGVLRQHSTMPTHMCVRSMHAPSRAQVLLPHNADVKIEAVSLSRDFLAVFERREGLQVGVWGCGRAVWDAVPWPAMGRVLLRWAFWL